ncbi:MAG TPA: hypothetical protein VFP97_06005 [Chitinophagaceae bacterium]|nr:hypothetical protein [Chitinophagaceae bacterium]
MSDEKTKITLISDLVKIDKYRSHKEDHDSSFLQQIYTDQSTEDLKKIHDIYTRYLLDYNTLGEPYPSVIESLEYTNQEIKRCITNKKVK